MDPREWPDDADYGKWTRRYGTTGVKNHLLEGGQTGHPENKGCIAVYREMTMNERQLMARLRELNEENRNAFDTPEIIVSGCLLYPTLDAYPRPSWAAAELFPRIRQHGHGPLNAKEETVTEDEDKGALPRHMVEDFKSARSAAYDAFHDDRTASVYTDLIVTMASGEDGIDPQTLDYLWDLSPGRIRDLAARLEQAHADARREGKQYLQQADMEAEERQARAKRIEEVFDSPLAAIDAVVGNAATPTDDDDEEDNTTTSKSPDQRRNEGEELPPNAPPSQEEIENAFRNA
jgi:hypothetical protein